MEKDNGQGQIPSQEETNSVPQTPAPTDNTQNQTGESQKSQYSDYVHSDGRKWDELTADERKKIKRKLNKKKKKQKQKQDDAAYKESIKGKSSFQIELQWCIDQIKLGITANAVTPEQRKETFLLFLSTNFLDFFLRFLIFG